jgi:hypothetical protein
MPTGRLRNWRTPESNRLRHPGRLAVHCSLLLILLLPLAGCRSEQEGDFVIYLLQGRQSGVDILGKNADQLTLQKQPLLTSQDITRYDPFSHAIELTDEAYRRIQALFQTPVKTDGIPFVVTIGKTPIYAGAFWTPLSSLSFDGVVILQPMDPSGNAIRIELGYPSPEAFTGSDPRADPRILHSLKQDGKIKE